MNDIRQKVIKCNGNQDSYIQILKSLGEHKQVFSIPIDKDSLSSIPIPSPTQIEKDLLREVLVINGERLMGYQGWG